MGDSQDKNELEVSKQLLQGKLFLKKYIYQGKKEIVTSLGSLR